VSKFQLVKPEHVDAEKLKDAKSGVIRLLVSKFQLVNPEHGRKPSV
jgi:hypothetical protein